jgi:hypothetical protein
MKKIKIIYWVFTGLFVFFMLGSAIPNIISAEMSVNGFKSIGYPAYLVPFLGVAKTLGVIAILVPGYSRIKEWAYAGLLFDLTGAVYSIIAIGAPAANWMPVFIPIICGVLSYVYYHKKNRQQPLNIQYS